METRSYNWIFTGITVLLVLIFVLPLVGEDLFIIIDVAPNVLNLGSQGEVVSPLAPDGMVRINGELWVAESESGRLDTDEKIIVVGQDGLKLVVRRCIPANLKEAD